MSTSVFQILSVTELYDSLIDKLGKDQLCFEVFGIPNGILGRTPLPIYMLHLADLLSKNENFKNFKHENSRNLSNKISSELAVKLFKLDEDYKETKLAKHFRRIIQMKDELQEKDIKLTYKNLETVKNKKDDLTITRPKSKKKSIIGTVKEKLFKGEDRKILEKRIADFQNLHKDEFSLVLKDVKQIKEKKLPDLVSNLKSKLKDLENYSNTIKTILKESTDTSENDKITIAKWNSEKKNIASIDDLRNKISKLPIVPKIDTTKILSNLLIFEKNVKKIEDSQDYKQIINKNKSAFPKIIELKTLIYETKKLEKIYNDLSQTISKQLKENLENLETIKNNSKTINQKIIDQFVKDYDELILKSGRFPVLSLEISKSLTDLEIELKKDALLLDEASIKNQISVIDDKIKEMNDIILEIKQKIKFKDDKMTDIQSIDGISTADIINISNDEIKKKLTRSTVFNYREIMNFNFVNLEKRLINVKRLFREKEAKISKGSPETKAKNDFIDLFLNEFDEISKDVDNVGEDLSQFFEDLPDIPKPFNDNFKAMGIYLNNIKEIVEKGDILKHSNITKITDILEQSIITTGNLEKFRDFFNEKILVIKNLHIESLRKIKDSKEYKINLKDYSKIRPIPEFEELIKNVDKNKKNVEDLSATITDIMKKSFDASDEMKKIVSEQFSKEMPYFENSYNRLLKDSIEFEKNSKIISNKFNENTELSKKINSAKTLIELQPLGGNIIQNMIDVATILRETNEILDEIEKRVKFENEGHHIKSIDDVEIFDLRSLVKKLNVEIIVEFLGKFDKKERKFIFVAMSEKKKIKNFFYGIKELGTKKEELFSVFSDDEQNDYKKQTSDLIFKIMRETSDKFDENAGEFLDDVLEKDTIINSKTFLDEIHDNKVTKININVLNGLAKKLEDNLFKLRQKSKNTYEIDAFLELVKQLKENSPPEVLKKLKESEAFKELEDLFKKIEDKKNLLRNLVADTVEDLEDFNKKRDEFLGTRDLENVLNELRNSIEDYEKLEEKITIIVQIDLIADLKNKIDDIKSEEDVEKIEKQIEEIKISQDIFKNFFYDDAIKTLVEIKEKVMKEKNSENKEVKTLLGDIENIENDFKILFKNFDVFNENLKQLILLFDTKKASIFVGDDLVQKYSDQLKEFSIKEIPNTVGDWFEENFENLKKKTGSLKEKYLKESDDDDDFNKLLLFLRELNGNFLDFLDAFIKILDASEDTTIHELDKVYKEIKEKEKEHEKIFILVRITVINDIYENYSNFYNDKKEEVLKYKYSLYEKVLFQYTLFIQVFEKHVDKLLKIGGGSKNTDMLFICDSVEGFSEMHRAVESLEEVRKQLEDQKTLGGDSLILENKINVNKLNYRKFIDESGKILPTENEFVEYYYSNKHDDDKGILTAILNKSNDMKLFVNDYPKFADIIFELGDYQKYKEIKNKIFKVDIYQYVTLNNIGSLRDKILKSSKTIELDTKICLHQYGSINTDRILIQNIEILEKDYAFDLYAQLIYITDYDFFTGNRVSSNFDNFGNPFTYRVKPFLYEQTLITTTFKNFIKIFTPKIGEDFFTIDGIDVDYVELIPWVVEGDYNFNGNEELEISGFFNMFKKILQDMTLHDKNILSFKYNTLEKKVLHDSFPPPYYFNKDEEFLQGTNVSQKLFSDALLYVHITEIDPRYDSIHFITGNFGVEKLVEDNIDHLRVNNFLVLSITEFEHLPIAKFKNAAFLNLQSTAGDQNFWNYTTKAVLLFTNLNRFLDSIYYYHVENKIGYFVYRENNFSVGGSKLIDPNIGADIDDNQYFKYMNVAYYIFAGLYEIMRGIYRPVDKEKENFKIEELTTGKDDFPEIQNIIDILEKK